MNREVYENVKILWDYMNLHMEPRQADIIVGFGCYNEEIALRAAELYFEGYAGRILFTGGLGRNTKEMWVKPEAERFRDVAIRAGVPAEKILVERESENSAENILFTRKMLEKEKIQTILGVHKPFMERRVMAAMGVYWPEVDFCVTSPRVTIEEYIALSEKQGMGEDRVISILTGDYQRVSVYAEKGYQLPQPVNQAAEEAFRTLCRLGYDRDLVK